MADLKSLNQKKNDGKGSITGVVKLLGQTQLPIEFITPAKSFDDALAKTTIKDSKQLYYATQLWEWFEDFDENGIFKNVKQSVINVLNGQNAINGINRSLAAMTYCQIYVTEGAGIKASKEEKLAIAEIQRLRETRRGEQGENSTYHT